MLICLLNIFIIIIILVKYKIITQCMVYKLLFFIQRFNSNISNKKFLQLLFTFLSQLLPKIIINSIFLRSTCKRMELCCDKFPLSDTLIEEVGKSSLYKPRSQDVNEILTKEEYSKFKPSILTMFAANNLM